MPELLERVQSVVPLDQIDYIVVNHVEPDHNGGMRMVAAKMPNAKIVASAGGVRGIAEYHGDSSDITAVGADDSLDLGGLTLKFMPMPMVHWPDSMFTYCPERCTLMPNDAFGQHLASSSRFADEVGLELATEELIVSRANTSCRSLPKWARRSVRSPRQAGSARRSHRATVSSGASVTSQR